MPIKNNREYRNLVNFGISENLEVEPYTVRGYATTFEPYVLFEYEGTEYKEQISRDAFVGADITDVIFQYNHDGKVFARTKNGTLELFVDEGGLGVKANLGTTNSAKEMYEEIRAGLIDQMSFAFTVAEEHYDSETHTRIIDRFKKIYDVSAVSIPANPTTQIGVSARSAFEGYIENDKQELLRAEKRARDKKKLLLKMKLGGF